MAVHISSAVVILRLQAAVRRGEARTPENDRSPEELSYNGDLLAWNPIVMSSIQLKQSWFEAHSFFRWSLFIMVVVNRSETYLGYKCKHLHANMVTMRLTY